MNASLITLLGLLAQGPTSQKVDPPKVIPLVIPIEADTLVDGQWVEVIYAAQPDGDAIHVEPGERVWQVQDDLVLMLGATGSPLPQSVTARAIAFVWIENDQGRLGPISIYPRHDLLTLNSQPEQIASQLKSGMPGLDAVYLTQVAHYLAGNLASLDVVGDSYSVMGTGTVINANGDWVGGRLIPNIPGGVFVGFDAGLMDDGTANNCTAVGANALRANVASSGNVAFGNSALRNSTESNNSAVGSYALLQTTTGTSNTSVGFSAMYNNTTGSNNTASGKNAMLDNTTGNSNTAIGVNALKDNVTGHFNTAIGGSTGTTTGNLSNTTAIGNLAKTSADNQVRIGNSSVTSIGGQVAWSTLSDGRFKTEISESVPGLSFILGLRPVTYRVDTDGLNRFLGIDGEAPPSKSPSEHVESGFIAQDVQRAAQSLGFDFNGIDEPTNDQTPFALRYAMFVVPLVRAIQEQQAEIDQLKAELHALRDGS